MKTISNFHSGIADDKYSGGIGEFAITKQFDILTYPNRLQPLRVMTADTANTGIGNIQLFSDGLLYGVGLNSANSRLWQRSGYGASDVWQHIPTTDQIGGAAPAYNLLVEYADVGSSRTIFWAETNVIRIGDKLGGSASASNSLTFTNIGQGFVHPKDKILYIPYDNKITLNNAGTWNGGATIGSGTPTAAFTLPAQYQIPCLTNYGNYLAIPSFTAFGTGVNGSMVYLSDRDTSQTTFAESINWGQGQLKVLNNLDGVLIGISMTAPTPGGNANQDSASIQIKGYSGGTEPFPIKELIAQHLPAISVPVVTINQRVNFVYKNRLYFSVNIVPTDGISDSYYGLFSVGKNKVNGRYTVVLERMATQDGSETGVIAAAIIGDFVSMCHTAVGTLTCTANGAAQYGATSVYESVVNPEMPETEKTLKKQLMSVMVNTLPLTSGQQVVMKYRVDTTGAWITVFTKTSTSPDTNLVFYHSQKPASGQFTAGTNIEFRLESTGGAVITSFGYNYNILLI